ncbi:integral membrane protein [Deinobacterium chartae]|uniref:Integral membrane protein n=1 Tax=Deinobacterium chartae TaxID=521158 RepID=A0A841I3J4_9DEIO|nr:DUF3817 domain-containing protein [Deinobacterium chartae]MBB6098592.1 integral membrane protein [Deinobacterium chartae]
MFRNSLLRLRWVGLLEGTSFLLLLGVAMPLKYLADVPQAVEVVGLLHGILFVLYLLAVIETGIALRWPPLRWGAALLAAVLPFGPFVFDRRLRLEAQPSLLRTEK